MECTQPERYVLKCLARGLYLGIERLHQGGMEVEDLQGAYLFHSQEVDVLKVEWGNTTVDARPANGVTFDH